LADLVVLGYARFPVERDTAAEEVPPANGALVGKGIIDQLVQATVGIIRCSRESWYHGGLEILKPPVECCHNDLSHRGWGMVIREVVKECDLGFFLGFNPMVT
jgi:hypothetical protein